MALSWVGDNYGTANPINSLGPVDGQRKGDLQICVYGLNNENFSPDINSSGANWTQILEVQTTVSSGIAMKIAWRLAPSAASGVPFFSASAHMIYLAVFRGALGIGAFDSGASGANTTQIYQALALEADDDTSWLFAAARRRSGTSGFSAMEPTGLIQADDSHSSTVNAFFRTDGPFIGTSYAGDSKTDLESSKSVRATIEILAKPPEDLSANNLMMGAEF